MPYSFSPWATALKAAPLPPWGTTPLAARSSKYPQPNSGLAVSAAMWMAAAPEVSGLGIVTRPFASAAVRSCHDVGCIGASLL